MNYNRDKVSECDSGPSYKTESVPGIGVGDDPQLKPLVQRGWNWSCAKRLVESLKHAPVHKILSTRPSTAIASKRLAADWCLSYSYPEIIHIHCPTSENCIDVFTSPGLGDYIFGATPRTQYILCWVGSAGITSSSQLGSAPQTLRN